MAMNNLVFVVVSDSIGKSVSMETKFWQQHQILKFSVHETFPKEKKLMSRNVFHRPNL